MYTNVGRGFGGGRGRNSFASFLGKYRRGGPKQGRGLGPIGGKGLGPGMGANCRGFRGRSSTIPGHPGNFNNVGL